MNYTVKQAAEALGIAGVTVYKWIEAGRLKSTVREAGFSTRHEIAPEDLQAAIDAIKAKRPTSRFEAPPIITSAPREAAFDTSTEEGARKWCEAYTEAFGTVPRLWGKFKHGEATFEEMSADVFGRIERFTSKVSL